MKWALHKEVERFGYIPVEAATDNTIEIYDNIDSWKESETKAFFFIYVSS